MSEEERKTLVCPSCGNTNPYTADECLKCDLALGPVRELLAKEGVPAAEEASTELAKPHEPVPSLPELSARPTTEEIGDYVESWRFLIRGMGDRGDEIAARFFQQLAKRGIEAVTFRAGRLIIKQDGRQDSRDYYFVERDLGRSALATMAVRIAPVGTDLFVEWRHYTIPPVGAFHWGYFLAIGGVACVAGCATLGADQSGALCSITGVVGLIAGAVVARGKARKAALEGFQTQDSTALQLAVRAALEEAIDLAGISKTLIQQLPKEERKDRRVI